MKLLFTLFCAVLLLGCQQNTNETQRLQSQINALKSKQPDIYTPGFGEFMSNIQVHHEKLWFAGKNENWKLADFEIKEIKENLDAIEKYQSERTESQSIPMMHPSLDSVANAIRLKNTQQFERSYNLLTNTCTNCHRTTKYEFIQIKIPDKNVFSNQEFKLQK